MDPIQILIVEDDRDMRDVVTGRFKKQIRNGKFQFHFAFSGREALELLQDHPEITVVMTDIRMPEMDGLTFLGHLKNDYPLVCPIVATAYADYESMRATLKVGAYDVVTKPLNLTTVEIIWEKAHRHIRTISDHKTQKQHVEEALRRSERQIRQMVEKMRAGIAIMQASSLVFVNTALCRMMNKSCEQLLQNPPKCLLNPINKPGHPQ